MVVSQSPAVGIETLLQGPWEGGIRGQGVVNRQDRDTQVLGPALQIGLYKMENKGMKKSNLKGLTFAFTVYILYAVKFILIIIIIQQQPQ